MDIVIGGTNRITQRDTTNKLLRTMRDERIYKKEKVMTHFYALESQRSWTAHSVIIELGASGRHLSSFNAQLVSMLRAKAHLSSLSQIRRVGKYYTQ